MVLSFLNIPFISNYSALQQSGIFATLLLISYLSKRARYVVCGLILASIGFKIIVPVTLFCYKVFKWIANFGFYIHYFQVGVGFITTGVGTVVVYLENRAKESEQEAEERRYREEAERRAQREQEHERRYHEEQEGRNHEEQERRNQQEAEKNQKRRGKRRGQH